MRKVALHALQQFLQMLVKFYRNNRIHLINLFRFWHHMLSIQQDETRPDINNPLNTTADIKSTSVRYS